MKLFLTASAFVLFLGQLAIASDKSFGKRISLMIGATSKAELIRINKNMSEYDELKSECALQLKTQQLPSQCFKQLDIEKRLKLATLQQVAASQKLLSRICEHRVEGIFETRDLRKAARELDPNLECAKRVKARIIRQEYKDIEAAPLELFESVHKG